VLVANTGKHRIEVFDLRGRPRGRFIHRVRTAAGLVEGRPTQLAIDGRGRTLVVDQLADQVDVVDLRGRSIAQLVPSTAECAGSGAAAVCVTRAGDILVGSRGAGGRIHRFDRDYRYLGCWGAAGPDTGQLTAITGIAGLSDGRVVVVCSATKLAVQIFEPDGRFVRGFGVHDIGPGNFSFPSGVATSSDDRIWVTDEIRQLIQVFDPTGRLLLVTGGQGVRPGQFMYPSALASDGAGTLAVSERVGSRLQLLRIR
jgi:hypothetical protein